MNTQSEIQNGTTTPDPASSIENPRSRRRNGNVARLPRETRQRINEMLDDGISYPKIIEILGPDAKDITPRCVMSWKSGGYRDYLRHQEMLQQCRARQFSASTLLTNRNSVNAFQATQQVATAQICETVLDVGTDILRKALVENPLNYFRMLNSFARLTNGGLKCERHVLDQAERKAKARRIAKPGKKGISTQSIKEMQDKLKLM